MTDALDRWRLVLGRYSERGLGGYGQDAARMGAALDELYERAYAGRGIRPDSDDERGAGLEASAPHLVRWLDEVRELFPRRTVEVLTAHALERFGLTGLVTDPQTLERLEPNEDLLRTVLSLKGMMSPPALKAARRVVATVVDELTRRLKQQVQQALSGRLDRTAHSPVAVAASFDPQGTIRANLKHTRLRRETNELVRSAEPIEGADRREHTRLRREADEGADERSEEHRDAARHRLVVERALFFERNTRRLPWDVIVCVDQSGSMVGSVVHAAVMAAILAALPSFRLRLVVFDTSVVDLSAYVDDPLEVLMTVQLGGGTDIAQAVRYCAQLVENPQRTVVVLVTDFCEGGSPDELVRQVRRLREAHVRTIGLAALEPDATPAYDQRTAGRCVDAGMPVAALTPTELVSWLVEVTS